MKCCLIIQIGIIALSMGLFAGCGKNPGEESQEWPLQQAEAIQDVNALIDGRITVDYAIINDESVFEVTGRIASELDIKIVKEGLEKLDPPLELVYRIDIAE